MNHHGFTLVELMLVICLVAVLAAVAVPKFAQTIWRAQQSMTLGNLAVMRSTIASYMTIHEGTYPTDNLDCLITEGYLRSIPDVRIPPNGNGFNGHSSGHSVGAGAYAAWGSSTEKWYYFNDPTEPIWFGKIVINCGHSNAQGIPWDQN